MILKVVLNKMLKENTFRIQLYHDNLCKLSQNFLDGDYILNDKNYTIKRIETIKALLNQENTRKEIIKKSSKNATDVTIFIEEISDKSKEMFKIYDAEYSKIVQKLRKSISIEKSKNYVQRACVLYELIRNEKGWLFFLRQFYRKPSNTGWAYYGKKETKENDWR
jgi:CII-binding regulator of phage lambda lysogenization HflD